MDQDRLTAAFYAKNAETYANATSSKKHEQLEKFMSTMPAHGSILELGCGGGRDSMAMLKAGFRVHPTDGSPEMAQQAEKLLQRPVKVMAFGDLSAENQYDGIWANACLLHVPREHLADILQRIYRALRPDGLFYASFKSGAGEGRDKFDRYYNYPTTHWLKTTYKSAGWENIEIEQRDGGGFDKVPTSWLHITTQKPA